MAPALTKVLNDGLGVHLSSCPAAARLDSAICSAELASQMKPTDDANPQMMWQFPFLDSRFPMSCLDTNANADLSQCLLESASQYEPVLISGAAPLLNLLSPSEVLRDAHQVASVFPGVSDMFIVSEHNGQEAPLMHGCKAVPDNGGHKHPSHQSLAICPPFYCHWEKNNQFCTSPAQEKVAVIGRPPLSSMQPCSNSVNSAPLPSTVVLEEAVKEHLSRQAGLQNRARGLQGRLQALLSEHAVLHCTQQLEGLKKHCEPGGGALDSLDSTLSLQVDCDPTRFWPDKSTALAPLAEVEEFSVSSQLVLRGLQEALDSDATASSSSDEEQEEVMFYGNIKTSPASCERQWLEERAELGSSWSWLQLRLSELEGRIQQLDELHTHIRSTKGGVVLAEFQPLADNRTQQSLLREMAGFSSRALDSDPEPYSPNRLLYSIERQSAQLSQLVNSLMPPLSLSPLSKQPHTCNSKIAFTSGQRLCNASVFDSCKRKRLGTRKLKAGACARTRPLAIYHKPRLFSLSAFNPSSQQDSGASASNLTSPLWTSSCSSCSACDPVVLCSDSDCSSSRALPSRTSTSNPQSVPGHSLDTPLSHHVKKVLAREEWHQRPFFLNDQPCGADRRSRPSCSPPLNNSHKYKQYGRNCKSRVMGLPPFEKAGSAQSQHRRASQGKRRRSSVQRLTEDEDDILYLPCDIEDSSDEVLKVTHKRASQGFVRKRQRASVCDIDGVVVPLSAAKVEKLQHKVILTPSWRVVDTSALRQKEAWSVEHSEEIEDLTDEIFDKRHLVFELREKLRSGSWGKRKRCRRPKRSGSRLSASAGGTCTSGEDSAMETCAQLDTDEQRSSKEWLPPTPWKRRRFPLADDDDDDDDDEEALLSISVSTKSKKSFSSFSPPGSFGASLPSVGQNESRTIDGS